ncbi:hypothetical protein J437_LFUL003506 [Ladona fulva]|uniref:Uncharacterized protein n=1 Tax=Ladona fulva TaxID=123851 RepID=A0A8K0NUX8_LADFU|nr:hypothetical protein J437_LFUL003506 [Ladona fulva]
MVWVGSKELGLGKARSRSGKVVVVANYRPPGNISGQFQQNVLPPIEIDISPSPGSGGGGGGGGGGTGGSAGGGGRGVGKGHKTGVGCLKGIRSRHECQHYNNNEDDSSNNNNDDDFLDEEKTDLTCACITGKRPDGCVVCSANNKYFNLVNNINCALRLSNDDEGVRRLEEDMVDWDLFSGDELVEGEDALSEYSSSNATSRSTEFGV